MKIRYLVMFKLILALFGCKKTPVVTTTSQDLGPFTIETNTEEGTYYNINTGRAAYKHVSYTVQYKGKPLQVSDKLEVNTGVPGIWRVFLVKDSPRPTIILGSQSLYLVTETNDHAVISPLFEQNYDFASIQWLDSEQGQPGIYREVYSSDEQDTETELSGGRYMAISHAAVLDVKTLTTYTFNSNNEPVDGFNITPNFVVAFSPDSSQLVYVGNKRNDTDYNNELHAMIVFDFRGGTSYAVPFLMRDLKLKNVFEVTNDLFNDYFEWTKPGDNNNVHLQMRKLEKAPNRKGRIVYERYPGYKYILDPVDTSLMAPFADFVSEKLKMNNDEMIHDKDSYSYRIRFTYKGDPYIIQYGENGQDVMMRYDGNVSNLLANKTVMYDISKSFNALLSEGKYQDLFLEITDEEN